MNIETLYQEWQALQPLSEDNQKRLDDKFMLEFNYNSNHIEGNTLTYGQTFSLLIHGKVEGAASMHDYEEMKAHHAALEFVKQAVKETEKRPLTEAFIRQVHKIMLKEDYVVYENRGGQQIQYTIHAGIYKTRPNSVKTQTGEIFDYASPEETPALMTDLVLWYNNAEAEGKLSALELASLFHYRYIRIHPFEDGNGRIARLFVNYILALHGYPMIVVHEEDKNNYINALEQCDNAIGLIPSIGAKAKLEQITPLSEYLEQCLERALQVSIKAAKGENIEEEDDLQKKLAVLARNAGAKRKGINRINTNYLLEIYRGLMKPLGKELEKKLLVFKQFYNQILIINCTSQANSNLSRVLNEEIIRNESISEWKNRNIYLSITLNKPTLLIPADSLENEKIYIACKDEEYVVILFGKGYRFLYGVLPTEIQREEWEKKIAEHFYFSIEKKVNSLK